MEKNAVKKKITLILLCLMMSLSFILTGCDLFPRNIKSYLERSVCTIKYSDETVQEITTEDFLSAYNSYGSSLVSNGSTYKEAASKTVDVLVNRKVLLKHAYQVITLTKDDELEILDDVYTSLTSNLTSYVDAVKKEWEIDKPTEPEKEESTIVLYNAYEPKAEIVFADGEYKIKLLSSTDDKQSTNFASLDAVISTFNSYANPNDNATRSKIYKEAYRRFVTQLKLNEEGLNLSTDNASVLKRYVEKIYKSTKENLYITSLEDYYKTDDGYSTITIKQVLDKYKSLLIQSKFKYDSDADAYNTAMLESFKDVYYAVNDKYFYVSNLLFKFSTEQQAEYDKLEEEMKANYISPAKYQERLNSLIAQIKATVRDSEGAIIENTDLTAQTVYNNLIKELNATTNEEQKTEIFKNYLYKYGEDTGTQNAEYLYVIGEDDSKMVESFTKASRELNKDGTYGKVSGLVATEYGVHVIFYAGKVVNTFTIDDISNFELYTTDADKLATNVEKIKTTKLSVLNNKTIFDKVFDLLSNDSYSIFENMNLNFLKKDLKITKHTSVYENL